MNSTQIAKLAGVSRSTVSKVLHNYSDIPEETKKRVLEIIKKYNYRPNVASQALRGINPKVIGVYFLSRLDAGVFERMNSHYDSSMLTCITIEAKRRGYTIMYDVLLPNGTEDDIVDSINNAFDSHTISCAVFIGLDDKCNFIPRIAMKNRHIIVLDKHVDTSLGVRCLYSNDFNSAVRACEHLYNNGFTRILHLTGDLVKLSGKMRRDGYYHACEILKEKHGATFEPHVIEGRYSIEHGYMAGRIFIENKLYERYNGIMCGCDMIGVGFIKYLREQAPELIDKVGVIGFDNETVDLYMTPALSTMAPDYRNFARFIFDLEQNFEQFKGGVSVKIEQDLIERDSSRPSNLRLNKDLPLDEFIEQKFYYTPES